MTALEQIPDTWDGDRDERFFRITARLLPSRVVEAGSALLASYDDDVASGEVPWAPAAAGTTPVVHRGPHPSPTAGTGSATGRRS